MNKKRVNRILLPVGRPSSYQPNYHPQMAHKLALLMATEAQMMDAFGVSIQAFEGWKNKHPEFREAIARGGIIADAEVGSQLKHRAMGYSHEAVKIFMPKGAREPVYAPYVEHYPPDTQAASLWLRNRQRGKWRDQQEHKHDGTLSLEMLVQQSLMPATIEHEPVEAGNLDEGKLKG